MDEGLVLSVSKVRLLALLQKAQGVIRFAQNDECNRTFSELAKFCQQASEAKDHIFYVSPYAELELAKLIESRSPAKRSKHLETPIEVPGGPLKKRQQCRCKPFAGTCPQDSQCNGCHSGFCSCCEGYQKQPPESILNPATGEDVVLSSYCSDCLCSLSLTQNDILGQEEEFCMMVGWFGSHVNEWKWIPVAVDDYGVFRSIWKWLLEKHGEDWTIEELIIQTARQALATNVMQDEHHAWTEILKDPTRVSRWSGHLFALWDVLLMVFPTTSITIYWLQNTINGDSELVKKDQFHHPDECHHKCGLNLLLWNHKVAPHYDLLLEK